MAELNLAPVPGLVSHGNAGIVDETTIAQQQSDTDQHLGALVVGLNFFNAPSVNQQSVVSQYSASTKIGGDHHSSLESYSGSGFENVDTQLDEKGEMYEKIKDLAEQVQHLTTEQQLAEKQIEEKNKQLAEMHKMTITMAEQVQHLTTEQQLAEKQIEEKNKQLAEMHKMTITMAEQVQHLTTEQQLAEKQIEEKNKQLAQSYEKTEYLAEKVQYLTIEITDLETLVEKLQHEISIYQKTQNMNEEHSVVHEVDEKVAEKIEYIVPVLDQSTVSETVLCEGEVVPGVCGVDMTSVMVTNDAQRFSWEGYGFKLDIPPNSLPEGMDSCLLHIVASVAGKYQVPENSQFVSAVYWIVTIPNGIIFRRLITVFIQHCCVLPSNEQPSNLSFVVARCGQESLPLIFERLDAKRQNFSDLPLYGSIQLGHFCGLGIVSPNSDSLIYCAMLFHFGLQPWGTESDSVASNFHLVISKNLEICVTRVKEEYEKLKASIGTDCTFDFKSLGNIINLCIPDEGEVTADGWTIKPLSSQEITKMEVDSFKPGCLIPRIQLKAKNTKLSTLSHKLFLNREVNLKKFVTIEINPTSSQGSFLPKTDGKQLTLEDLKRETGVSEVDLDREISEQDFGALADDLSNCSDVLCGQSLRELLSIWKQQILGKVTYRKLAEVALSLNKQDMAVHLCQLLNPASLSQAHKKITQKMAVDDDKLPLHSQLHTTPGATTPPIRTYSLSLEELPHDYRPKLTYGDLDKKVSDEHIRDIYQQMDKWQQVASHLGLTDAEVETIQQENNYKVELMRLHVLKKWKKKEMLSGKATYGALIEALLKCGCAESVIRLCKLLVEQLSAHS